MQILPKEEGWGDTFRQVGQIAGESFTNQADERAIREAVNRLGPDASGVDIVKAITGARTYSPEAKQTAIKNYIGAKEFDETVRKSKEDIELKKTAESNKIKKLEEEEKVKKAKKDIEAGEVKTLVDSLPDLTDEQRAPLYNLDKKDAAKLVTSNLTKNAPSQSIFDKTVQKAAADDYVELTKTLPLLEDAEASFKYVRGLSNKLGGAIKGTLKGLAGTETAKELEAASFPLIQPIVKIFNPSGPLAQRKLEMLTKMYQIKATDFPWQREGKLKALEHFSKQALARGRERKALIEKYHGMPPKDVIEKFDKESDTMSDAMIDYDFAGEEAPDVPAPAAEFKNKVITGPDGQKYYSDGTRWTKR